MKVDRLIIGLYQTNCYLLRRSAAETDCLVLDPGLDHQPLLEFLRQNNLTPVAAVLTHGHIDHIASLRPLLAAYPDLAVYIHKLDAPMLTDSDANLAASFGLAFTVDVPNLVLVEDGDRIQAAQLSLEVLHTPGHTPGGICLYARDDGAVFTNDTLFTESIGRTDFPGGDMHLLLESIRRKLFCLPDETIVYPGHGPSSTIAREKTFNPFFR